MFGCLSRRLFHSSWGLAAAVLLLLTGIDTALTVAGVIRPWDEAVTRQVYRFHQPWLDLPMVALTCLGRAEPMLAIAVAVALWALTKGRRLDTALLLAAFASALIAQEAIKRAIQAPRPLLVEPPLPIPPPYSYGYASGHALVSIVVLGFSVVVLWDLLQSRLARRLVLAAGGALIAGIGLSRVYLGVHWANDVVGGYLYGALILLAVSLLRCCGPRR